MSGLRILTTAMAVALLASPLSAQRVSSDTSALRVTPAAPLAGMRLASDSLALLSPKRAPAGTKVDATRINAGVATGRRIMAPESSQSAATMIVGGTALLVGTVVSGRTGSIIMISGGVVGLVGLWRYAR